MSTPASVPSFHVPCITLLPGSSTCCQATWLRHLEILGHLNCEIRWASLAKDQSRHVAALVASGKFGVDVTSRLAPGGIVPAESDRCSSPLRQLVLDVQRFCLLLWK